MSTVFSSPSSYIVFSCPFSPFYVSSGVIFYPVSSRSLIGAFMLLLTAEKYVIDSANNFSCPRFKYKALSRTDNPEYINISVYITMAPTLTDSPQLLTSNHGRNGWKGCGDSDSCVEEHKSSALTLAYRPKVHVLSSNTC